MNINQPLIDTFRRGMTDETKNEIIRQLLDAEPNASPLLETIDDVMLVKVIAIAARMIAEASAKVSQDISWENLTGTQLIIEGMKSLLSTGRVALDNPALDVYTMTIMWITIAMLKGE